jgi:CRISPR/Cas system-associated exonuclease Cas4 (RecB family)
MAKATDALRPLIRDAIRENRDKPPLEADSWIRMSGVSYLCAREEVLCARDGVTREDKVEPDLALIFEHGNALHWVLQNRILPATKTLLGRWICGECGAAHGAPVEWEVPEDGTPEHAEFVQEFEDAQMLRPETCEECNVELTSDNCLYVEQYIKSPEYLLDGHPDGFLRLEGLPGLGVLEVKSISSRGAWEVRGCPKLDHVTQAQGYMWRTGCRWGLIIYWDKGANGMKALIVHLVEYDEDHVEAIKNLLRDIREGVSDPESKLPERICASSDCKRANLCGVAETCFEDV